MVIVVRIDLDKYEIDQLTDLVRDQVVTISEARESGCFKALTDYDQLMQVREWQRIRG